MELKLTVTLITTNLKSFKLSQLDEPLIHHVNPIRDLTSRDVNVTFTWSLKYNWFMESVFIGNGP